MALMAWLFKAEAHSDDSVFEVEFDAVNWFEKATDEQIRELAEIGWGGNTADEIAQFCKIGNAALVDMFGYLARIAGTKNGGFECTVDRASVELWLNKFRPLLMEEFQALDIF